MVCELDVLESSKKFVNTLEDNILEREAMNRLISDSYQVERKNKTKDIIRALIIEYWQSDPYYQHQKLSERRF